MKSLVIGRLEGHFRPSLSPYFTFVPAGTLALTLSNDGSPSRDAARIMPLDSMPISLAGWRLATITILRPTSSSGVYFVAMPATIVRSPSPVKTVSSEAEASPRFPYRRLASARRSDSRATIDGPPRPLTSPVVRRVPGRAGGERGRVREREGRTEE